MLQPRLLRELTLRPAAGQPSHVSAASGIVVLGEHFYVVADDEAAIGRWPLHGDEPGRLITVFDDALPEDPRLARPPSPTSRRSRACRVGCSPSARAPRPSAAGA
jgi:hypothetical protein